MSDLFLLPCTISRSTVASATNTVLDHDAMSDWHQYIPLILRNLRYREQWVTRSGGTIIALSGGFLAYLVAKSIDEIDLLLRLAIGAAGFIVFWIVWISGRALYFRRGRGSRIGISYEGYRVSLDDWAYTRSKLTELFQDGTLRQRVSLRLLPWNLCSTDVKLRRIQKKLGFSLILRVSASPNIHNPDAQHLSMNFNAAFKAKLSREFVDATLQHALAVASRSEKVHGVSDALNMRSQSLFDFLLLMLGVMDVVDGQVRDASPFLRLLESRIASRFAHDQNPRKAIRWMDSRSLTKCSHYPGALPPGPEVLDDAIQNCEEAIDKYGDDFPDLMHMQARNMYFVGRLDEALKLARSAMENALDGHEQATATLSMAFLHLVRSEFETAARHFSNFLSSGQVTKFSWDDLVGFADSARAFGHEHAVFIQALYRRIRGDIDFPPGLHLEVTDWLRADRSRSKLQLLYSNHVNQAEKPKPKKGGRRSGAKKKKKQKKRRRK